MRASLNGDAGCYSASPNCRVLLAPSTARCRPGPSNCNSSPDQAGAAFRQFIKDFYQENKLIKGEVDLNRRLVDLKSITMPVLNIYATEDHLVPPLSSKDLEKYVETKDFTTMTFPGGHGIHLSSRAQTVLALALADWVKARG